MTNIFSQQVNKRAHRLYLRTGVYFPDQQGIISIRGIHGLEELRKIVDSKKHAEDVARVDKYIEEHRKALAKIGIVDDASSNAYMDKVEARVEGWVFAESTIDDPTDQPVNKTSEFFVIAGVLLVGVLCFASIAFLTLSSIEQTWKKFPEQQAPAVVTSKDAANSYELGVSSSKLKNGGAVIEVNSSFYGATKVGDTICIKYKDSGDRWLYLGSSDIENCKKQ